MSISTATNTGAAGFAANHSLPHAPELYRFNPGIPIDVALEQASTILAGVIETILSEDGMSDRLYGAAFMAEAAKAAIDAALAGRVAAQQTGGDHD